MAKNSYIGVGGKARKITKYYIGDENGKARKVTKAYIGDEGGKARLFFTAHEHNFNMFVTTTATCTSAGTAIWACACGNTTSRYDAKLPHSPKETAPGSDIWVCTVCGTRL